ncbi:MAG TPA: tyrosine-type recombinase/integrase [Anaerolineales bacterium]|nr:tyrosine-type recombinase/integrase [Anaerolineales bacterium]
MNTLLQPITISESENMQTLGFEANRAAESAVFAIYQDRRPINTQRGQRAGLKVFSKFLQTCGIMPTGDLYEDPNAWHGITWGLCAAFQKWQLREGYSIKTINDRVSIVKVYMTLANSAGIIPDGEIIRLQSLKGYTVKEGIDADAKRTKQGLEIRKGTKKAKATTITEEQAQALCKVKNDMPQARRDALMMILLLDHGMRVSELAILKIEDINFQDRQMIFYRPKVGKWSTHNLRGRAWQRLCEYVQKDNRAESGPLILASHKTGQLTPGKGMATRSIQDRVRHLGQGIGIEKLSPHDCRHYGATQAGHDPRVSLAGLMAFGGWASPSSAARYIDHGDAENDGVFLGLDDS